MKKTINASAIVIVLLSIAVVAMSFGFAGMVETLTINGDVTVQAASWKVHYKENSLVAGTGTVTPTVNELADLAWTFKATLAKPDDFYEYTATIENAGTLNAVLNSITLSPALTADQQKYLSYEVTYTPAGGTGTKYTASASGLNVALAAEDTATVNVKVTYIAPADEADLPETNQEISFTASLGYSQAE